MNDLAYTYKTGDKGGGMGMPICPCDLDPDSEGYHIIEHIEFENRIEGKCQCGCLHVKWSNNQTWHGYVSCTRPKGLPQGVSKDKYEEYYPR